LHEIFVAPGLGVGIAGSFAFLASDQPHSRPSRKLSCARNLLRKRWIVTLLASCVAGGACGCGVTIGHPTSTNNGGNGGTPGSGGTLLVSSSTVSFGSVLVGQKAAASVILTNGGSAPVQISQMQILGQYFSVAGQGSLPITVAGGGTYNLNLQFDPTTAGAQTGTLTLTSNASSGATAAISLSGTGETAPGVLSGLSCSSNSMTGAGTDACTVTLTAAADTGGLTVDLSSSNSELAVPSTVVVAAGSTTATFIATASAVTTAQTATITATAGGMTETYAIALNAEGATGTPALTLSPSVLSFGNVTLNTPATQTVTLSSTGTAALTISAGAATGTGFSMSGLSYPVTLNPGQTATLTVGFDPTTVGTATGTVSLTDNASTGTAAIRLTGTGAAATGEGVLSGLTCSSDSLTGAGTDACTVTLTAAAAAGGLTVDLSSSNSELAVPSTVIVAAGSTMATFTATATAVTTAQTATVTATADSMTETYAVTLDAEGSTVAPALTLSPSVLSFGNVTLNTPATQTVTLSSTGTAALTISAGAVTGTGFSISGVSWPVTLNPGQTATLTVGFDPTTAGAATGTVTLTDNASSGTAAISLTGTGAAATGQGVLSGLTCASGSMTGAGTDACTVTLTAPADTGGLTVDLSSSNSELTVPSTVIVAAGATTATFTATGSAVTTAQTATLTATADSMTETYAIALNAEASIGVPALMVSPGVVSFGNVSLNTPATQTVTLSSTGTAALTLSAGSVTGSGFSISGMSWPVTLNPGQTATLTVGFDPTAAGAATGAVTLTDNATPGTTAISLTGTGAASPGVGVLSGLTCSSNSLTGAGTDACTVMLTAAAGAGGLTVDLSSSNSALAVPSTVIVAAGATTATFTAMATVVPTTQMATVTAGADGATETYAITLNAQVSIGIPALTLSPSVLSFGNVNLNTPATQTVTLSSTGTAALTISAGAITGTGFSMSGMSWPVTLNPGQTATLNVQFDPTATGAATGAVTLTDNALLGTAAIVLTGIGETGSYEVDLNWDAPGTSADPVAGYKIYRAVIGSATYQVLNAAVDTATTYADTSVANGTGYNYYVTSVDAEGNESGPSNIYSVIIP
jgi:hypothetical protein